MNHDAAQKWIATGKDGLALLRDLVLVALFAMLLLIPAFIGERLSAAGFEEGNLMGFKWQRTAKDFGKQVLDLKKELEVANRRLRIQTVQLDQSKQDLLKLRAMANSPQQKKQINDLLAVNQTIHSQTLAARRQVTNKLASTQSIAQVAREVVGSDGGWAVVMGADRSLDDARFENKLAITRGLPSVGLYQRQGFFRTVAVAPTRQEAESLLPVAKVRSRDAYVVALDKWCPNRDIREGYTVCLGQ